MFELKDTPAFVGSFNPRAEIHGEEKVPAGDISLSVTVGNAVLDEFDPSLKSTLYRKPDKGEQQELGLGEGDGFTARRMPKLDTLAWKDKLEGYTLTITEGLGLSDPIVLSGCVLSKFKIDPKDGGSVDLGFRVSAHPDTEQSGKLCSMIQSEVTITLERPRADAEQQGDMAA